jgi:hypothetical protein
MTWIFHEDTQLWEIQNNLGVSGFGFTKESALTNLLLNLISAQIPPSQA